MPNQREVTVNICCWNISVVTKILAKVDEFLGKPREVFQEEKRKKEKRERRGLGK